MKIALLGTRGIPARYGGFETFAEELCARLAERGHEPTVYGRTNNVGRPGPLYRGVRLVVLPTVPHKYFDTLVNTCLATLHLLFHHHPRRAVLQRSERGLHRASPAAGDADGSER